MIDDIQFLGGAIKSQQEFTNTFNSLYFSNNITPNGLGFCDGIEIEAQMFSLVQMFNRIPNIQFSTSAYYCKTLVSCRFYFLK